MSPCRAAFKACENCPRSSHFQARQSARTRPMLAGSFDMRLTRRVARYWIDVVDWLLIPVHFWCEPTPTGKRALSKHRILSFSARDACLEPALNVATVPQ